MDKATRESREYKSLFTDDRYAKKAWRTFMDQSLQSDAVPLPDIYDAKGNLSLNSVIYNAARSSVKDRLLSQGLSREPMKAEILVEANVIRGAFDTSTFNTMLERTAGKVKDEISITAGAYEELTDEQLELLAEHERIKKANNVDTKTITD